MSSAREQPPIRALLVEDDDTTRTFLREVLESLGHEVSDFASAEDGMDAYRKTYFPIVVADWLMPPDRMNGLDLIRQIREHPWGSQSMILVITVRDKPGDLDAVLDAGADDYLPKPVSPEVLRTRLRIAQDRLRNNRERATAERALRASEAHLHSVVANAPLVMFLLDSNGVFTYADGRGLQALTLTPGEIIGHTVFEVYRGVPEIAAHVSRALAGEEFTATVAVRGVTMESWYAPLRSDPKGSPDGVIIVATDVSEQRKAADHLRQSEARFRSFSEAAFEGLVLLDRGVVVDANRQLAEMFGVEPDQVVGKAVRDYVADADLDRARHFAVEGRTEPFELTARRDDGSRIRLEVRLRSIPHEGRSMIVVAVNDITRRRQAEQDQRKLEDQFRRSQKLESLGVLAGGIAHDFNNLLMGVLGNASLALMDLGDDSPTRAYVEQIESAAQRAAELTNQMLAFSGKGRFVIAPLSLSKSVSEMAGILEKYVGQRTSFQYRLDEDIPDIDADQRQIQQILVNLVSNAADAIGQNSGVVRVSTGVRRVTRDSLAGTLFQGEVIDGYKVYLEVRDSGMGMDEETLARIFDPFFTTKFAGRGLGMAAVLGIVRGHKGVIKVASQPRSGTTVTMLFPPSAQATKLEVVPQASDTTNDPRNTILVIDDEETVRAVTETMLMRAGYSVLTAADGHTGIQLYGDNRSRIAGVLLDLTMPDLNGDQVFEAIREMDQKARVILMSGYDVQEATNRFAGKGLTGFLQKPFAASVLKERVAVFLES